MYLLPDLDRTRRGSGCGITDEIETAGFEFKTESVQQDTGLAFLIRDELLILHLNQLLAQNGAPVSQ